MKMNGGVSLTFFCRSIQILTKLHGDRGMDGTTEEFRAALQRVEELYLAMPPIEKKPRKTRKTRKVTDA
jgi:hypothetical protein